ncbi:MAG TPA: metallophosphoesterase [Acetobacteraceae bacterium]|jgi:DNA repair exonuclease SbcCD nuclease subunit
MPTSKPSQVDIVLVHSSDLHVDDATSASKHGEGIAGLTAVLAAAHAACADIVLLAGDTFDNNRVPSPVLARVADLLADAGRPIVILPGNHDPALPDSVFVRGGLAAVPNVSILGITHEEAVGLPCHDLEIWGHAHRDYEDMAPLRGPRPRTTRWQIAMAHGHYEPPHNLATPLRPSWLFSDAAIAATAADYLALGHWDRHERVGDGSVPAYYSGSPDLAKTVNLIRLTPAGEVLVMRELLRSDCT